MPTGNDAASTRYLVPALKRGLEVLEQFDRDHRLMSGAEIARRMKMPRASVFRIVQTLEACGYLERVGDAPFYRLSLGVLRLGFEQMASMELTEVAKPVLEILRDRLEFSTHLVIRDGRDVVVVAKEKGRNSSFHSIQVGARLPLHATVLGRQLLVKHSKEQLEALFPDKTFKRFSTSTPGSVDELAAQVDFDRIRGYGISEAGYEVGICAVAAPVFYKDARVAAAINITIPGPRLSQQQRLELGPIILETAQRLTKRLAHITPP